MFEKDRNFLRAEALILSLKQENESLENEIRKIKIQNLDSSLGLEVSCT